MSSVAGVWGQTQWGQSYWNQPIPPADAGWGADWRWWYQVGSTVGPGYGSVELTGLVVEARWTTDSYTQGDGTYRGDLQPGKLTLQLWDPGHTLDGGQLDPLGCIFARYQPTGAMWIWYFDTITRGLFAPGDPTDADTVITALSWPVRLTAPSNVSYPAQPINTRLSSIVNNLNNTAIDIPRVTADLDGQSQAMASTPADQTGRYPSYLQAIRDASVFGCTWLDPTGGTAVGVAGALTLRYRRWETGTVRTLDPAQVLAGPPVTRGYDFIVNQSIVQPLDSSVAGGGTLTQVTSAASNADIYGISPIGPMRVWDLYNGAGANYGPINATVAAILSARQSPNSQYLSTVSCQSGYRWTAQGRPSPNTWDPATHVWSPVDILQYVDPTTHVTYRYRVCRSDHRLTARVWATTHTLELATTATALPA